MKVCASCRYEMSYAYPSVTDPLGTTGQQDKWRKHTSASSLYERQSVLNDSSSSYYGSVVKLTLLKGVFDSRDNSITHTPSANSSLGWFFRYGIPQYELDTLKVVGLSHTTGLHLYLTDSKIYIPNRCHFCGRYC